MRQSMRLSLRGVKIGNECESKEKKVVTRRERSAMRVGVGSRGSV